MKINIATLGCKVNQTESAQIAESLEKLGHSIVDLSASPDYCIINTCSVTAKSDYQSRQLIRKAQRSGATVIVTGCYAEVSPEKVSAMGEVHKIINNSEKFSIVKFITGQDINFSAASRGRSRIFVKVQDGCDFSCSYCIIPKARGKSRCVPEKSIISEINMAVINGYNEVTLTGINLGLYGHDINSPSNLGNLVKTILKETDIKKIRLSSIEMNNIDDNLLNTFNNRRLCNHLHLPLQHGDDNILKLMNRKYTSKEFEKKFEHIMRFMPEISIGTDVITGFPGESEKEFNNLINMIERLPFSYLHVFSFSPRPNTIAYGFKDTVGYSVKKQRNHLLRSLSDAKKRAYQQQQIGKILDVIIEEAHTGGAFIGTSSNYLTVRVDSSQFDKRSLVSIRIESLQDNILVGKPINSN